MKAVLHIGGLRTTLTTLSAAILLIVVSGCSLQPEGTPATPVFPTAPAVPASGKPTEGQHSGSISMQADAVTATPSMAPVAATQEPLPEEPAAVSFVDATHGWLADGNAILATSDGGQNWTDKYRARGKVWSLSFVSTTQGWAAADDGLLATQDGGATWNRLPTPGNRGLYGVNFVDASNGWYMYISGDAENPNILLHTEDGGKTSKPVTHPCPEYWGSRPFSFVSPLTGYMVCGSGPGAFVEGKKLLKTLDGGQTWQTVSETKFGEQEAPGKLPSGGNVGDLFFLDSTHGWFSTRYKMYGGLYATADGGQTWRNVKVGQAPSVPYGMSFVTPMQGYTVYESRGGPHDHVIYKTLLGTRNGGAMWVQLYPRLRPTGVTQFLDRANGFAAGTVLDQGAILRTKDGGGTWVQVGALAGWCDTSGGSCEGGCEGHITGLDFADLRRGWASTECERASGTVRSGYMTTDGGATWAASQELLPGATPVDVQVHIEDAGKGTGPGGEGAYRVPTPQPGAPAGAPNSNPNPNILREKRVSLSISGVPWLAGTLWQMWQPEGVPPLVAANGRGILWVRFPGMVADAESRSLGLKPRPAGDYSVMYTQLRPGGGDLEQGATEVLAMPGTVRGKGLEDGPDRYPVSVEAVAGGRFLLRTYTIPAGAQSGGITHIWLLEPGRYVGEIVAAVEGGGHFLTEAHNTQWLFWNSYEDNTPGHDPAMKGAQASIVDLQTGKSREVHLGGGNWTKSAAWQADGRLHFKLERGEAWYTLNPESGQVTGP